MDAGWDTKGMKHWSASKKKIADDDNETYRAWSEYFTFGRSGTQLAGTFKASMI